MAFVRAILDKLERVKTIQDGWMARCPCHDDSTASLHISVKQEKILLFCHGCGAAPAEIVASIGMEMKDLFLSDRPRKSSSKFEIIEVYDYLADDGKVAYQNCRVRTDTEPKTFLVRRPRKKGETGGGKDPKWVWKLEKDVTRYPYRLAELLAAPPGTIIWINNGEKSCNRFKANDLISTCSVGGEGKWPADPEFNGYFKGLKCVIIADNDPCLNPLQPRRPPVLCGQEFTKLRDCKSAAGPDHRYSTAGKCKNIVEPEVPAPLCGRLITDEPQKCLGKGGPKHSYNGLNHALDVQAKLTGVASDVRILTAVDLSTVCRIPKKGDGYDYFELGGSVDALLKLAAGASSTVLRGPWAGTDGAGNGSEPPAWPAMGPRGMTHDVVRDWWLAQCPPTIYARGQFYRYDNGLWTLTEEGLIKQEIDAIIDRLQSKELKATSGTLSSVFDKARARLFLASSRLDANPDFLVLRNGALHIPSRTLHPHRPELYATTGVGFDFDPKAEAPTWQNYLERLAKQMSDEQIGFLQEFVGLCATADNRFEISVWLYGTMGSGKGTFIDGVKAALKDRYCVLSLSNIDQSRFMLGDLPGKTLAICQEQPGGYSRSFHVLDQIISGEEIQIDIKHYKAITINPTCKVLFAMTDLPRAGSAGDGIFRRANVVEFPTLNIEKRDPGVKEKIKEEGAGILNWALDGLYRLRKRGRFIIPALVKRANTEFIGLSDIESAFVAECCDIGEELEARMARLPRNQRKGERSSVLYQAYSDWCKKTNHRPKSSTSIRPEWRRLGFVLYEIKGIEHWHGLKLKGEGSFEPLLGDVQEIEQYRL
jgi:P4 family phage/plasmid primase-like protien